MIGHARRFVFTEAQLYLLAQATRMVEAMPDEVDGEEVHVHEVARAVGNVLDLEVVDGTYGVRDHSWCITQGDSTTADAILDPYVWGRLPQVQLITRRGLDDAGYAAGPPVADILQHVVDILVESGAKALANPYARPR